MKVVMHRWILALAAVAAAPAAHAQSTSAQAERLFDGGRALLESGKIAEACAAFESSQKLEPHAATLLNLASCREKNKQLATARSVFAEAGQLARGEHNDKLVNVALHHQRRLEPLVSKLTIAVAADHAVPGLELLRNGDKLDPASWNHPQLVDGGSYTITARAPGRAAWTVTKQVQAERDAVQIEIPVLVELSPPVAAAPPPASPVAPSPEASSPPPAPREPTLPTYRAAIAVGAGALVLGGVGIYFEVHSHSIRDEAVRLGQQNDPRATSRNDDASRQRIIGEVFDVAALAAAGVSIYLGVRVHRERESFAIAPVAGPALTGVAISGHW